MFRSIPLIRASVFGPFLKWAIDRGRPAEAMLRDAGLGHLWLDDPDLLIPFLAVAEILDRMQREEGPDIGCRVVTETSIFEIGLIGRAALSARSLREAAGRVAGTQSYNVSTSFYSFVPRPGGLALQHGLNMPLPPAVLHVAESYTAALLASLCRHARLRSPAFEAIEIVPHPDHGVAHLQPWFDCEVRAARRPPLCLHVSDAVLDAPFPKSLAQGIAHASGAIDGGGPRLAEIGVAESTRLLVRSMLRVGAPTVERMAGFAGMSVRSYQRRLAEEGATYSAIVEEERRRVLQETLGDKTVLLADVATHLGYARQSSLTRAVRRWTGKPPQSLRDRERHDVKA